MEIWCIQNNIFSRVYLLTLFLAVFSVYLKKPFGFHLPPREVVHANILSTVERMRISSLRSMNVQRNFSVATRRALCIWTFFKGSVSSVLIPKEQEISRWTRYRRSQSFGWIKEHALCGLNRQILARPAQSFPELTGRVRSVGTGVQNEVNCNGIECNETSKTTHAPLS